MSLSSSNPVPNALLNQLDHLQIVHETISHPAFFTVADGQPYKAQMPGGHTKNLFLKDKAGVLTFICAHADSVVDLKALAKSLRAKGGRLSFVKGEAMSEILDVIPGAVTPFALMNDTAKTISHIILDQALMASDRLWVHPLHNEASTAISPADLLKFIENLGLSATIHDFSPNRQENHEFDTLGTHNSKK